MDLATLGLKVDSSDITRATRALSSFERGADQAENASNRLGRGQRAAVQAFNTMRTSATALYGSIFNLRTAFAALGGAVVAREFYQAATSMQAVRNGLEAATGSAEKAGAAFDFVRQESGRLGLEINTAAQAYVGLAAASKGTILEGKASEQIFSSVAQAMTVLGKDAATANGALLALQQMVSKGTISAEELRGQLGERLPGAVQIMAKAMNVGTAELGKMLELGKVGIDVLPKFAAELDKIYGPQAASAARNLAAEANRVSTAFTLMYDEIGRAGLNNAVADVMREISSTMEEFNRSGGAAEIGRNVSAALRLMTEAAKGLNGQLPELASNAAIAAKAMGGLFGAMTGLRVGGPVGAFAGFALGVTVTNDAINSLTRSSNAAADAVQRLKTTTEVAKGFQGSFGDGKTSQMLGLGFTQGSATNLEALYAANQFSLTGGVASAIKPGGVGGAVDRKQVKLERELLEIRKETLTEAERYQAELAKLQSLHDQFGLSSFNLAKAQQQAAERVGATWAQASASIAGSFADIGHAFGSESKSMARAAQIFGGVQATISMFTGAAKALELPFPANLAAMAAVLAQGASFVASIKSQEIPAFQYGGSFKVGGHGGVDSQLVAFKATPGEMVDVRTPGQANGSNRPPAQITLVGKYFTHTREEMRDFLEMAGLAVKDGMPSPWVVKTR